MRVQPGPEEAKVRDIREMALTELSADIEVVKDEFDQLTADLANIKSGVSRALGMFKPGASAAGPITPVLGLVTSILKNS